MSRTNRIQRQLLDGILITANAHFINDFNQNCSLIVPKWHQHLCEFDYCQKTAVRFYKDIKSSSFEANTGLICVTDVLKITTLALFSQIFFKIFSLG